MCIRDRDIKMLLGKDFKYFVTWQNTNEKAYLNYNEFRQLKETCDNNNITILVDRDVKNLIAYVTII
jgi:hypothetical protein